MQKITEYLINRKTVETLNTEPYYYTFIRYSTRNDEIDNIYLIKEIKCTKRSSTAKYIVTFKKYADNYNLLIKVNKSDKNTDAIFFQKDSEENGIMYFVIETQKLIKLLDEYVQTKTISITYLSEEDHSEQTFTKKYNPFEGYQIKRYKEECKELLNI